MASRLCYRSHCLTSRTISRSYTLEEEEGGGTYFLAPLNSGEMELHPGPINSQHPPFRFQQISSVIF
jgi:hypothetical protein